MGCLPLRGAGGGRLEPVACAFGRRGVLEEGPMDSTWSSPTSPRRALPSGPGASRSWPRTRGLSSWSWSRPGELGD